MSNEDDEIRAMADAAYYKHTPRPAQPSLPHDELSVAIANCLGLYHVLDADKLKVSRLKALILAQRQEAAKAELIKMRDEWGYANTVDSWEDYIEKRLAALQTYLEGEVKS